MSTLIEALNSAMTWLETYLPDYAAPFLPGLTLDEILEAVESLGFPIPDELYELYEWRNGTNLAAPSFEFPSFE